MNTIFESTGIFEGANDLKSPDITVEYIDFSTAATSGSELSLGATEQYLVTHRPSIQYNPEQYLKIRNSTISIKLNYIFDCITDAFDASIENVERSNLFDEWKEGLDWLSQRSNEITAGHRKILGSLIVATLNKDVSDFSADTASTLRAATNMLRRPSILNNDIKREIGNIVKLGSLLLKIDTTNLSSSDEKLLDEKMEKYIKRFDDGSS